MDELSPEMVHALESKAERRRRLAALSYPEKVAILIRLQKMAAPIRKARGLRWRPWTCLDNVEDDAESGL
jgi:hypothetical protein